MIVLMRSLAAGLALAACLAAAAHADTRTVDGSDLILTTSQSSDVVIDTDTSLSHQIRLSADGDLGCLSIVGEGGAAVVTNASCSSLGRLTVSVPRNMPLTISSSGSGDLRLPHEIDAPLTLTMSGSGDVVAGRLIGPLVLSVHGANDVSFGDVSGDAVLDMAGSGDVRLTALEGAMVLKHSGNGDLAVGRVQAGSVVIDSTGSGDMLFGRGEIRELRAHLQGNGDLGIAADVHDGDVRAYGGGDVKLGKVTGTLNRANGENSDIYVGGPDIVDSVVGQVAKSISESKSTSNSHGSSHTFTHVMMAVVLAIVAFIVWRITRGPGRTRSARLRTAQATPTHPGVVAICEKMARMEERLGRVETYVTSREFDLQQKFRNL